MREATGSARWNGEPSWFSAARPIAKAVGRSGWKLSGKARCCDRLSFQSIAFLMYHNSAHFKY